MLTKNQIKLAPLYDKPFFTTRDISNILGMGMKSSSVFCSRYSRKGVFIKLKNNYYSMAQKWEKNSHEDYYKISSILRVPSYISLLSALHYYEITTQIPNSCFESVTTLASKEYSVKGVIFRYHKINKDFFRSFVRKNEFFVAGKEKAFLDAVYLYSFGKYKIDLSAINLSKLDLKKLSVMLREYPEKTRKAIKKICRI